MCLTHRKQSSGSQVPGGQRWPVVVRLRSLQSLYRPGNWSLHIGRSDRSFSERFAERILQQDPSQIVTLDDSLDRTDFDLNAMANRRRTVAEIPIHNLNGSFSTSSFSTKLNQLQTGYLSNQPKFSV